MKGSGGIRWLTIRCLLFLRHFSLFSFLQNKVELGSSTSVSCGKVVKRLVRKIHVVVERRIAKKCIEKVEVQVVILT